MALGTMASATCGGTGSVQVQVGHVSCFCAYKLMIFLSKRRFFAGEAGRPPALGAVDRFRCGWFGAGLGDHAQQCQFLFEAHAATSRRSSPIGGITMSRMYSSWARSLRSKMVIGTMIRVSVA